MGRAKEIIIKLNESSEQDNKKIISAIYNHFPSDMKKKKNGKNVVLIDVPELVKIVGDDGLIELESLKPEVLVKLGKHLEVIK